MSSKIKKERYPVQKILSLIDPNKGRVILDGDIVRVGSMKLLTFKHKGIKCVDCGIEGSFFRKEQDKYSNAPHIWHLNLYAINEQGQNILMTKDHILPVSKGGKSHLNNLRPMCAVCNNYRENKISWKDRFHLLTQWMKFSWE